MDASSHPVLPADAEFAARISSMRRFNRFYTRKIGALQAGVRDHPWSLTEARVLYELAQREVTTARELVDALALDAGYLSRILAGFRRCDLLERKPCPDDARRSLLRLTQRGRATFHDLDALANHQIGAILEGLTPADQRRLISALQTVEDVLGEPAGGAPGWLLRGPEPGDLGWVVHRHGVLYAQEHGFDERFEALVARIVADFVDQLDTARERCWIAERDGRPVGSVFLVRQTDQVAKLRLLLVEPKARGLGIGARLIEECLRFARRAGYGRITLWTNDVLHAARHLYEKAGFELVAREPHRSFGPDLIGESWERTI